MRRSKSKKLGPFRATVSRSGISGSVGSKHLRATKRAGRKTQVTGRVPGTQIRKTATVGAGKPPPAGRQRSAQRPPPGGPTAPPPPPPAGVAPPGHNQGQPFWRRAWDRFRSWPTWIQVTIWVLLALTVIGAIASPDEDPEQASTASTSAAPTATTQPATTGPAPTTEPPATPTEPVPPPSPAGTPVATDVAQYLKDQGLPITYPITDTTGGGSGPNQPVNTAETATDDVDLSISVYPTLEARVEAQRQQEQNLAEVDDIVILSLWATCDTVLVEAGIAAPTPDESEAINTTIRQVQQIFDQAALCQP